MEPRGLREELVPAGTRRRLLALVAPLLEDRLAVLVLGGSALGHRSRLPRPPAPHLR